jgi:ABC-type lipoprotein release transport system permease subunit
LYGVRATDALSFAYAAAALLVVTAVAALIPALRATRIDPVRVLRAD